MPTLADWKSIASRPVLVGLAALCVAAPGVLASGTVIKATGVFGVSDDVFGSATPIELLDAGDTFSIEVPIHAFTHTNGGHGGGRDDGRGVGDSFMWYGQYPDGAEMSFAIGASGVTHTYGLGPHGLTYEVFDDVMTDDGVRDELVIEFWPTPNSVGRHGDSIFTFRLAASFDAGTWDSTDPVRSIDFASALGTEARLSDDDGFGIAVSSLLTFTVPAPGGLALFGAGVLAGVRRRR